MTMIPIHVYMCVFIVNYGECLLYVINSSIMKHASPKYGNTMCPVFYFVFTSCLHCSSTHICINDLATECTILFDIPPVYIIHILVSQENPNRSIYRHERPRRHHRHSIPDLLIPIPFQPPVCL